MENHLCICKRWSWKPITGTHWSSVERPSAGWDYWPLRFISPQSLGNYAPSPNMHTQTHCPSTPAHQHPFILAQFSAFYISVTSYSVSKTYGLVDGEVKMRWRWPSHHHLNSTPGFLLKLQVKKERERNSKPRERVHVLISASTSGFGVRWRLWANVALRPSSVRGTVTWRRVNIRMTLAPLQQLWPHCPRRTNAHTAYGGG